MEGLQKFKASEIEELKEYRDILLAKPKSTKLFADQHPDYRVIGITGSQLSPVYVLVKKYA